MNGIHLALGLPSYGDVKQDTNVSLVKAFANFPHALSICPEKGPYLDVNRERIVAVALAAGATHLMFIDSDIQFPPDGVLTLLSRNKDIIGGNYNKKKLPRESAVTLAVAMPGIPDAPFPVSAVPSGFLLINLATIVAKMQPPYFWYGDQRLLFEGEEVKSFVGEDTAFCIRARRAGLTIWCDPTILLHHIGDYAY